MRFIGNRYELLNVDETLEFDRLYKARDVFNNKKVLIKVVEHNPNIGIDFVSDLIDEFTEIHSINCPYILKIIDVGVHCTEDSLLYYFVSEYSGGITLDKIIAGNYIHLEAIINMSTQILKGLEVSYTHNLYHGDLKPSNILVDKWYNIKICDFGVTKANKGVNIRTSKDLSYLCPHQLNINYTDQESDFFALGLILFESIFKKLPFKKTDKEEEMLKIIDKGINWNDVVTANGNQELIDIIKKLLRRKDKYISIQEIIIDLSKVMYEKADIEDLEEDKSKITYIEQYESKKNKAASKKIFMATAIIVLISLIVLSSF
ncbi:MAG: protein kinase [Romboutsia sp.]